MPYTGGTAQGTGQAHDGREPDMDTQTAARATQEARRDYFAVLAGAEGSAQAAQQALTEAETALLDSVGWDADAALAAEAGYVASLVQQ
jgi:hypothetical protein